MTIDLDNIIAVMWMYAKELIKSHPQLKTQIEEIADDIHKRMLKNITRPVNYNGYYDHVDDVGMREAGLLMKFFCYRIEKKLNPHTHIEKISPEMVELGLKLFDKAKYLQQGIEPELLGVLDI
jgi:hypothetical protein